MTPAAALLRGPSTISMTCVVDGKAHEITDHAMAASHAASNGNYRALCGHRVMPAPLVEPNGVLCQNCLATLYAGRRPEHRDGRQSGRHRRPIARRGRNWLRGLFHVPVPPTVPLAPSPSRSPRRAGRAPAAAGPELTPTSSGLAASQQSRAEQ